MIRILAGQFRSRVLVTPKGSTTRPTSSQLRAAVFNICQNDIAEARFLDICAGSGGMGFEALSRGAQSASFIEQSRPALLAIKENVQLLQVQQQCHLLFGDAVAVLKGLEGPFDICYFDPPYTKKQGETCPLTVGVLQTFDERPQLLAPHARLFVEESIYADLSALALTNLTVDSVRRFGSSQLFCFIHKTPKR